jgi:hypothetical protein
LCDEERRAVEATAVDAIQARQIRLDELTLGTEAAPR